MHMILSLMFYSIITNKLKQLVKLKAFIGTLFSIFLITAAHWCHQMKTKIETEAKIETDVYC